MVLKGNTAVSQKIQIPDGTGIIVLWSSQPWRNTLQIPVQGTIFWRALKEKAGWDFVQLGQNQFPETLESTIFFAIWDDFPEFIVPSGCGWQWCPTVVTSCHWCNQNRTQQTCYNYLYTSKGKLFGIPPHRGRRESRWCVELSFQFGRIQGGCWLLKRLGFSENGVYPLNNHQIKGKMVIKQ